MYIRVAMVLGGLHGYGGFVAAAQVPDGVGRSPALRALDRCMAADRLLSRHGHSLFRRCAAGMAMRAEDVCVEMRAETWADSRARRRLAPGGPGILGRLHRG